MDRNNEGQLSDQEWADLAALAELSNSRRRSEQAEVIRRMTERKQLRLEP